MNDHSHVAIATGITWGSWFTWFMGHIVQINEVLQFGVLLLGLISAIYVVRRQSANK